MGLKSRLKKWAKMHPSTAAEETAPRIDAMIDEAEKNRQRVEEARPQLSQQVLDKVDIVATKVVNKTLGRRLKKLDLPEQVKMARRMLRFYSIVDLRAQFLKPSGFPLDIHERRLLLQQDLEREPIEDEVLSYWLECPEFMSFWAELQMGEEHLRELYRREVGQIGNDTDGK